MGCRGKGDPDLSFPLPPPRLTMQIPKCYGRELTSSLVVWLELIKYVWKPERPTMDQTEKKHTTASSTVGESRTPTEGERDSRGSQTGRVAGGEGLIPHRWVLGSVLVSCPFPVSNQKPPSFRPVVILRPSATSSRSAEGQPQLWNGCCPLWASLTSQSGQFSL